MILKYIRMAVTLFFLVGFSMLLLDFRYPRKRSLRIVCIFTAVNLAGNLLLFSRMEYADFAKIMPLSAMAPYLLLFYCLSTFRDLRLLFSVLTVYSIGVADMGAGAIISNLFFDNSVGADLAARVAVLIPISIFLVGFFREPYLQMLYELKKGWAALCLIPLLFFAEFYFLAIYPSLLHERPENLLPIACSILMLFASYGIIAIFFRYVYRHMEVEQNAYLLKAQVDALTNQIASVNRNEEKLRIQRHDLRHYIRNIGSLLKNGNVEDALQVIDHYDEELNHTKVPVYCANSVLNAVFSFYLEKARQEGIQVKLRLNIPERLPVDVIELSTVFANAIENSCNACRILPPGTARRLEISCEADPHLVFEIVNSCSGRVALGNDGLPRALEDGHGIGMRSIAAFARKYNAFCDCRTENGMFYLRVLVQKV